MQRIHENKQAVAKIDENAVLELDMNESLLREAIRGVILREGGRGRRVIAFDFHDTLVSDKEGGGYEPRERMIDKVRGYYGNYDFIVIYTAAPESDRAEVASYLEKFKIPYDVLVMEKPRFDKMYDDRYIGPEDDWV